MTPTNWPNLEQPGYHWLKCKSKKNSDLEIFYWDQEDEVFRGIGDVDWIDKFVFPKHWEYHGPVLNPDQIKEMRNGWLEQCIDIVANSAPGNHCTIPKHNEKILTEMAEDIVEAIREMGDAP